MEKIKQDYLLTITNIPQKTTFGVPVSIEELTTIIKRLSLLDDKRYGSFYEGNVAIVERYFEALELENQ